MAAPNFYGMLSDLGDTLGQNRAKRDRDLSLADLGRGASLTDVATRLIRAGDMQGGMALATLANTQSQQDWTKTYQGGMLGIAQKQSERREEPENVRTLRAAGIDPNSPEGRKALFPRTDTPISATDKKVIIDAEDELPQLQGTKEALLRAKELNSKTFTGLTAGLRGTIATKVPGGGAVFDKNAGLATEEWSKIMGPEALQQMANTLKGATTDFELRTFIGMLADPSTDPKVREKVIERMEKLTDRKLEIQQSRVKNLRGGDYFKPGGGAPQPQTGKPISQQEYQALPSGATYTAPDGSTRTKR